MKSNELNTFDSEKYTEFRYFKGEANNPYDWNNSPILFKWWNFEKDYFDNYKQSGQWKTFAEFLEYWIKEKAAPEIGHDLSNGNKWIDEYKANAPYIQLKDYLINERKVARKDYFERIEHQENIIKRHNELSGEIAKATTKEQLTKTIMVIDSLISNFNDLESENLIYLGDIPETYLTNTWKDFVKEWKPKFEQLRDRAKFKADNMKQQSPELQQIPKELQTDKAKALFQKAISAGLVESNGGYYKWIGGTGQLLAYFTEKANKYLNLKSKLDSNGNQTINWKAFEIAFNTPGLKNKKQDWMKLNLKFTPSGYEKVDMIFD